MRTTKELLEVMLENIDGLQTGLCLLNDDLHYHLEIISGDEHAEISNYLAVNLPKHYDYFSWKAGEKQPRIEWLKQQIEKLEQNK